MSLPAQPNHKTGLVVQHISGGYGDTLVLRGVSFSLGQGQVLGIVGRNGVGKTSLLRLITGHLPIAGGTVSWQGRRMGKAPAYVNRDLGISYAPQEAVVFDALTVSENLNLRQRNLDACQAFFYSFPLVRQRRNQKSGVLSGGEKKLVSFVRVMAEGADLTVMDEPTEGVQQENIALMAAHVRQRCEQGASFIIAEQNLTFLLSVMHQVLVLDNGETVFQSDAFDREGLEQFLRI
ncbi:MAG: ATP-binding cassette domain-containing protein [Betaproteobacteria bacterium]|jgi:ABC-type branched-subunit amino acid transport system ATPase component